MCVTATRARFSVSPAESCVSMASQIVNAKWFDDEIPDPKLAFQAFDVLEKHFPEAEADYRHDKKHCTKWSHVCWEIGRSLRLRLDQLERLPRVFADLADFCPASSQRAFSRLLFELSENGQLPDRVLRMLPQAHLPAILPELAEWQRLKELHEEDLRRMDQMGY